MAMDSPIISISTESARMKKPKFIVCESSTLWACHLSQHCREESWRVIQLRSPVQSWKELERFPASLVVWELTKSTIGSIIESLIRATNRFPLARSVVVGTRDWCPYEWVLREAGAVDAIFSPRDLGRLTRLAKRHFESVPIAPQSWNERIWSRLPWGKEGS